jgi:hypothetical protein
MSDDRLAGALKATPFIDANAPAIRAFVERHAGSGPDRYRAVRLYYAVRDAIPYDLRYFGIERDIFVASRCLEAKGLVLRAQGGDARRGLPCRRHPPARVGFADVRNHLASPRILELMGTDVFRWHAYTLLHLEGRWVKATPAFDLAFCARFGVEPLDFDGSADSIFQPFDAAGRQHMDYVFDRGDHDEMPFEAFRDAMQQAYPRLITAMAAERAALAGKSHPKPVPGEQS